MLLFFCRVLLSSFVQLLNHGERLNGDSFHDCESVGDDLPFPMPRFAQRIAIDRLCARTDRSQFAGNVCVGHWLHCEVKAEPFGVRLDGEPGDDVVHVVVSVVCDEAIDGAEEWTA